MEQIYSNTSIVLKWLGSGKDNSDIAMDYITSKMLTSLKPRRY
jgi:hypothetical protein